MNSIPSENRSPSERCDQREDNLCLGISEAVPTAGPSVWNDGGNQTAEEGWSGAAVHRRGEMGLPPPRWDSRVELVEEGGETRLPEEEFQEAPKGFGLSKWKNGCHSPSPQPPSPGKVGFGKSPVRRESKIPASIPRSSTSRTLREARSNAVELTLVAEWRRAIRRRIWAEELGDTAAGVGLAQDAGSKPAWASRGPGSWAEGFPRSTSPVQSGEFCRKTSLPSPSRNPVWSCTV